MGACFYRLRCEVFQNLFLSPMNTGFVRPAIAIVPTACGIETLRASSSLERCCCNIAIVPTACGIETPPYEHTTKHNYCIAIVPTACGIETYVEGEITKIKPALQ